jgi:hypothetical protein
MARRDVVITARIQTLRSQFAVEQGLHVFERSVLRLWIEEVDDWNADEVDCHENEVGSGTNVLLTDGPDLSGNDRTNGASRGSDVQSAGAISGGEDLEKGD